MKLIRGLPVVPGAYRGAVIALGTFDGLHLGHQALIARTCERARARGACSLMLTFEPMPREYLSPGSPPARLTNFRERWRLAEASGLDAVCVLRFDAQLREWSDEEFARRLARAFDASLAVVGHDFRYGRGGAGTAERLVESGRRIGFGVEIIEPVIGGGERVSSTAVRGHLARGEFDDAARLLGRRYTMRGRVARGEQLGRTLGFPTANLRLRRRRSPLGGIFAVRVHGIARGAWPGVASLGTRPTVGGVEPWLETYLFDFAADIYGREIEVEFVAKIRDEAHFATLEAMVGRMHDDVSEARRLLGV
ncbi:MAG: Riboflavin biosynthesis protein RibF [Steroidobacteraceae bacterium]|nr:Riboflavin biosynthesis protein RibF [Steroidobacteraceae bacterium]